MGSTDISALSILWEVMKFFVTPMLVITGWMVVSDQQEVRELAKSRYARLYVLRDELRKIEASAIAYHTSSFDQTKARSLIRGIKALSDELSQLKECGGISFSTLQEVIALRRAMTMNNCGSPASFKAYELDSEFISEIEAAVAAVDRQLLRSAQMVATTPRTLRQSVSSAWRRRI